MFVATVPACNVDKPCQIDSRSLLNSLRTYVADQRHVCPAKTPVAVRAYFVDGIDRLYGKEKYPLLVALSLSLSLSVSHISSIRHGNSRWSLSGVTHVTVERTMEMESLGVLNELRAPFAILIFEYFFGNVACEYCVPQYYVST